MVFLVLAALLIPASRLYAATTEIFPSNADASCNEEFENVANKLQPGDRLVLHSGVYTQACRRLITGRHGTVANPIIIEAAAGETPILTRPAGNPQNNIEIENSSYLVIRGIRFRGGDSGVRFMGLASNITFENNEISNVDGNALTTHSGNFSFFSIRRNHIYSTGRAGSAPGEAMYIGCHDGGCISSNFVIENNYIHDLAGDQNDGIEIKYRSHSNLIRNNVITHANRGAGYPCILVYGGDTAVNTVEGNVMWNCGEGIYVVSDAVLRNNIVFNSGNGIASYPHAAVPQMRNLTITNNTVYNSADCLFLRWSGVTNGILANNAVYCAKGNALNGSGLTGLNKIVRANYLEGNVFGGSIDNVRFFNGGTASNAFVDPTTSNFWPKATSILRSVADPTYVPSLDFNETSRTNPFDVGAYETEGLTANPGWKIAAGFKSIRGENTVPVAPTNLQIK
jgi:hypothetical protein